MKKDELIIVLETFAKAMSRYGFEIGIGVGVLIVCLFKIIMWI